jgi:hypothetical protein
MGSLMKVGDHSGSATHYPFKLALICKIFVLQICLSEVEGVELVERRGYLTLSLGLGREGRLLLRRTEGIRDWYTIIHAYSTQNKVNI